jgi:quercetin dioxygenase-like cupin family protein
MNWEGKRHFKSFAASPIFASLSSGQQQPKRRFPMFTFLNAAARRGVSAAALLATATFFTATGALAGECPAGKTGVDVTKPGPMAPAGVTDTVIASIDLKAYGFDGRLLRMRRLVVQPGGIVPWHSHGERPANILIVSGTIVEYRSTCSVPIVHKAGDVTAESGALSHWWKNTSRKPAVLISSDILPPAAKPADNMM